MRLRKIHLHGVHHRPSKMYLLLLMCVDSFADAERRGWKESGSFSPRLPALRGGSGSAKDRSLRSVQETENGIRRSLEPWGLAACSPCRPQLEKGMATHSSILTWRIPWTEEPGGLQSVGLQRIGHD